MRAKPGPCPICGVFDKLHIHHLYPKSYRYLGNNYIRVCRTCHADIHEEIGSFFLATKYNSIDALKLFYLERRIKLTEIKQHNELLEGIREVYGR